MELSGSDHSPTQSEHMVVVLARSIFVARGILVRANTLLVANEPKPWSRRIQMLRKENSRVIGILADAWERIPQDARKTAISAEVLSEWAPPNKVAGAHPSRHDVQRK